MRKFPNCELCEKVLSDYRAVRCRKCLKKGNRVSEQTKQKISQSVKSFIKLNPSKLGFKKGHTLNVGRKYPEERNIKIRGANSPHWKGGITPTNELLRHSQEYKLWRKAIFERDNHTCVWCGARNGNGTNVILNADHIKRWADFPELRFAIDNGRTLCVPCHKTTDGYKKRNYDKK
jgi:ribosomal protein L40E